MLYQLTKNKNKMTKQKEIMRELARLHTTAQWDAFFASLEGDSSKFFESYCETNKRIEELQNQLLALAPVDLKIELS